VPAERIVLGTSSSEIGIAPRIGKSPVSSSALSIVPSWIMPAH